MVVYAYKDKNDDVVYVGKTKDVHKRHLAHIRDNLTMFDKSFINKDTYTLEILHICNNPIELSYFEKFFIKYYNPIYNIDLKPKKRLLNYYVENISLEDFVRIIKNEDLK